jgi:hypothetical protein
MTENISRQPKGIPAGGQFAATAHSEPQASLVTPHEETAEEARHREFWERAIAGAAEREERIRKQQAEWAEARKARGDVQEEEPATYEYVPESVPPVHTGWFRRAFAAIGSFSTSVDQRYAHEKAEIAGQPRGGSILPRFLRRNR